MNGKKALLGPPGRVPGSTISFVGSILRTATMTCDLAAHRRCGALQASGDITNRRTGSEPPRNVLSLNHCEREQRAPTKRWNNPTVMRQQTVNGGMRPVKGAPNRMQRLSRFPAAPYVSPLRHRKLHVFPLRHRHHLERKIYIRWCCIDLLSAPGHQVQIGHFRSSLSRRFLDGVGYKAGKSDTPLFRCNFCLTC